MSPLVHPMTSEEHRLLDEFVSELFGLHFPEDKKDILASRLEPRLQALRLHRFLDYYLLLQYDSSEEIEHLARLVSNNESYFFREIRQFEALFEEGVDHMAATSDEPTMRFLCAGCSSGEEPYTLSIYCSQHAGKFFGRNVSIQGFDIDHTRITAAERASYTKNSLRVASEEQIRNHFSRNGDEYELQQRYRKSVSFTHGNILDLPTYPASNYDAIFCRNVLIYFSEPALHRAVENFAAALRPGGLLFLGHSESIIGLTP
ncbi:MAG: protein-glutamate O-methyltransferase CheR, partial [Acidobacteriota bacterium]|nr:protein-glutamate O-methyltransferase CheR [Acidobacteriota bacterium]